MHDGKSLTLTFHRDGALTAFGGINRSTGSYKLDQGGESLRLTLEQTTKAGGDAWLMRQEERYLAQLSGDHRFQITGGHLTLSNEAGDQSLQFKFLGTE